MALEQCPDCKEYPTFGMERHTCAPIWVVHKQDYHGDDWRDGDQVRARHQETAASKWADEYDSGGDYDIVAGRYQPIVSVRREDGGDVKWFRLYGEAVAHYYATEVEEEVKE